jgi:hypothetical protein
MKSWILFGSLALSAIGSVNTYYIANRADDPDVESGLWCVFSTDGSFQTQLLTTQRDPAGFDNTRAQMSYYHSGAHQNHKKFLQNKKLQSL